MHFNLSDSRIPLRPGALVEVLSGAQFRILKHLGSGGFGLTYLAQRPESGSYIVLKELYPAGWEDAVITRQENGKITVRNPVTDAAGADNPGIWSDLRAIFQNEARMAREVGSIYDSHGCREQQNNPDIFRVEGPFTDKRGNTYLTIDTYRGEPLGDYLRRGFVPDRDGSVQANQFLAEIIDILIATTLRLSQMHGNNQVYHLDLSCNNIYLVKSAGGTRLDPFIIDYGSAYCRNNPVVKGSHLYTCNPFSAPEVQALAQLQDGDAGYAADESSDTYSLVAILFYAVTGRTFTAKDRLFRDRWQAELRRKYPTNGSDNASDYLKKLFDLFEKGLAASQSERYTTAGELRSALLSLKNAYRRFGNFLPLVSRDELMSYMLLEKYPLYHYRSENGDIHVLCLGCGVFIRRMILSLISCGQMIDGKLHIHAVSNEDEANLKSYLLTTAPALRLYSNLAAPVEHEYVRFTYNRVKDVRKEDALRPILEQYPDAAYILVSLGRNSANIEAANLCAKLLARAGRGRRSRAVINYYCSEDAANNTRANTDACPLPDWLCLDAFANDLSNYSWTIQQLGLRTQKLAHLYNKLSDPRISLAQTAGQLAKDKYSQRSSCAAALHLKYKLAALGLNPGASSHPITQAYRKVLTTDAYGKLLELEHRRWMMYMIADGYTAPTRNQLMRYGFEKVNDSFNGDWKCKAMCIHPCLVPCNTAGPSITPHDWEKYTTEAAVAASGFDPLDQVSLKLRILAKEKCLDILEDGNLGFYFKKIEKKLERADVRQPSDALCPTSPHSFQQAKEMLKDLRDNICTAAEALQYSGDHGQLAGLEQTFSRLGINISQETDCLRQSLGAFAHYASRKDYKLADAAIVDHLLWVLYAEDELQTAEP